MLSFFNKSYFHYIGIKLVPISCSPVSHFRAVVVDGSNGISEKIGNLFAVGDAQSDQCENAQFSVEQFGWFEGDLLIGVEQCIELIDKRGEKP